MRNLVITVQSLILFFLMFSCDLFEKESDGDLGLFLLDSVQSYEMYTNEADSLMDLQEYYTYDVRGNQKQDVRIIHVNTGPGHSWGYRMRYEYNMMDQVTHYSTEAFEEWRTTAWQIASEGFYTYNKYNQLEKHEFYNYGFGDGAPFYHLVENYTYDTRGYKDSLIIWKRYNLEDSLQLFRLKGYQMNSSETVLETRNYIHDTLTDVWNLSSKYISTLDADGNEVSLEKFWYTEGNFVIFFKELTTYNNQGGTLTKEIYWNTEMASLELWSKTNWNYDEKGNLTGSSQWMRNNSGVLYECKREEIAYDSRNLNSVACTFSLDSQQKIYAKQTYFYFYSRH
ncbi:MAG: hypothetical protein U0T82_06035 [Bacteroidales bacterium]